MIGGGGGGGGGGGCDGHQQLNDRLCFRMIVTSFKLVVVSYRARLTRPQRLRSRERRLRFYSTSLLCVLRVTFSLSCMKIIIMYREYVLDLKKIFTVSYQVLFYFIY